MIRVTVNLIGDGYTDEQALTMKADILAYAVGNNMKGSCDIINIIG